MACGVEREPEDLVVACRALAEWRQAHGGRGRAIPEAVWARAVDIARRVGVARVARALRLDSRRLQARMPARDRARRGGLQFVELTGVAAVPADAPAVARASAMVVEFAGQDGRRVRVEVSGGDSSREVVVALARSFWSLGR